MTFTNYRKETSERSDASNWAKKILVERSGLFFDSIEGCNENNANVATHMMERARVDITQGVWTQQEVLDAIINLEGKDVLQRKINFAKAFQLPLTYVLYCDEKETVSVLQSNLLAKSIIQPLTIATESFLIGFSQSKGGGLLNRSANVKTCLILIKLCVRLDVHGQQILTALSPTKTSFLLASWNFRMLRTPKS